MANVSLAKVKATLTPHLGFGIKFVAGSVGSYVLNIALTYLLTELFGWHYLFSFAVTQFCLVCYAFSYNLKVLFPSAYSHAKLLKFVLVLIGVSVLNILTVRLITESGFYYVYSVALSVAGFVGLKYFLYKTWVFRPDGAQHT